MGNREKNPLENTLGKVLHLLMGDKSPNIIIDGNICCEAGTNYPIFDIVLKYKYMILIPYVFRWGNVGVVPPCFVLDKNYNIVAACNGLESYIYTDCGDMEIDNEPISLDELYYQLQEMMFSLDGAYYPGFQNYFDAMIRIINDERTRKLTDTVSDADPNIVVYNGIQRKYTSIGSLKKVPKDRSSQ